MRGESGTAAWGWRGSAEPGRIFARPPDGCMKTAGSAAHLPEWFEERSQGACPSKLDEAPLHRTTQRFNAHPAPAVAQRYAKEDPPAAAGLREGSGRTGWGGIRPGPGRMLSHLAARRGGPNRGLALCATSFDRDARSGTPRARTHRPRTRHKTPLRLQLSGYAKSRPSPPRTRGPSTRLARLPKGAVDWRVNELTESSWLTFS